MKGRGWEREGEGRRGRRRGREREGIWRGKGGRRGII